MRMLLDGVDDDQLADESPDPFSGKCFLTDLKEFCLNAQIPQAAFKVLFQFLRQYHPEVPNDPRTLMQQPRTCVGNSFSNDSYVHPGLKRGLLDELQLRPSALLPEMRAQLHIDEMKLFKGSGQCLWPITGRVSYAIRGQPFVVGVFSGSGKPEPLDVFLGQCISELKDILTSGLQVPDTDDVVRVELANVICNTPARSYVWQVKAHNGYYGCDRCCHMGTPVANHMTFPVHRGRLRDDRSFRMRSQEQHHKGTSPFEDLPIDMVASFPIDYMHLVCLGVMRKLLHM
ncbi:hypothetical protein SprV_0702287400 [Sparganum proliferum]